MLIKFVTAYSHKLCGEMWILSQISAEIIRDIRLLQLNHSCVYFPCQIVGEGLLRSQEDGLS